MNTRIDKLMIQAGARFEFLHGVHYDDFQYRKFAELIVAECMKVVINGKYSATECEGNTHRIAHNNARSEASSDIKKHFGVKP